MKKDIDIIACDLDGTLLNDKKKIDKETREVLLLYQKKNKTLVLVSGRYYHELKPYIEELKLKEHHGYAICCNGYEVYDIAQGSVHRFDHIPASDVKDLMNIARDCSLFIYLLHNGHYQTYTPKSTAAFLRILQLFSYPIAHFASHKQKHVLERMQKTELKVSISENIEAQQKMCFLGSPKAIAKFQNQVDQIYQKKYHFFPVTAHACELVSSTVSKALAVSYVCNCRKTSMEHVVAFGDSGNDKVLLTAAGLGVAMKNGFKDIRECADAITDFTNEQQGVARFLKKHIQ